MKSWLHPVLIGVGCGATFLLGQLLSPLDPTPLLAQGRGAVNPPPPDPKPAEATRSAEVVYTETAGSASSSNGFVAVTGSYGVGTSVLYVLDTERRQLAVYEARGGSSSQHQLVLIGARRIDLDLQLEGYNDRSEFDYERLERLFAERGSKKRPADPETGLEPDSGRR
jgi:hypothetical protein